MTYSSFEYSRLQWFLLNPLCKSTHSYLAMIGSAKKGNYLHLWTVLSGPQFQVAVHSVSDEKHR